jgi:glycosyltransferase involved in cell wall biosynthesis
MAKALAGRGADVLIFLLCHEEHQAAAYYSRFKAGINYKIDFGFQGRLFNGRTKVAKLINNIRISFTFSIRLLKHIRRFNPDSLILSRGSLEMCLPVIVIARFIGIPVIGSIMEFGPSLTGYRYLRAKFEWYLITKFSNAFFLISHYLVEKLGNRKLSMYLPVMIDKNYLGHAEHKSEERLSRNFMPTIDECPPILLYSCSSAYVSLLSFCLQSLAFVNVEYLLIITGHYPVRERMRLSILAKSHGIHEKVKFSGYLSDRELDLLEYESSAMLMPLLPEAQHQARFPQKLLHYMLLCKPVITTDVGEIHRFFRDQETAFIDNSLTPVGYAEKIEAVLKNTAKATTVAQRGRILVEKQFDHMLWGSAMVGFIQQVGNKLAVGSRT